MILTLILSVILIIDAIILSLCYTPKRLYTENDCIYMKTLLGTSRVIPIKEITVREFPEGGMSGIVRTNGLSAGRVKYGHYKSLKTGQKYFLFLTGRKEAVSFEYDGRIYITDNWQD